MNKVVFIALMTSLVACQATEAPVATPEQPVAQPPIAVQPSELKQGEPKLGEPKLGEPKLGEPVQKTPEGGAVVDGKPVEGGAPSAELKEGHFGGAFTLTDATPLKDVLTKSETFVGQNIKVSGTVNSVCRKKGCWMVIQSGDPALENVRVTMKDYGFFVPKDCDGKAATVEGILNKKVVDEATRKHLAEDQGTDPAAVQGDAVEFNLVATAIQIGNTP